MLTEIAANTVRLASHRSWPSAALGLFTRDHGMVRATLCEILAATFGNTTPRDQGG